MFYHFTLGERKIRESFGDPLRFMQKDAKAVGVELDFSPRDEESIGEVNCFGGGYEFFAQHTGQEEDTQNLYVKLVYIGDNREIRNSGIRAFARNKKNPLTGKSLRDFDQKIHGLDWFDAEFRPQSIGVQFSYYRLTNNPLQELWAHIGCVKSSYGYTAPVDETFWIQHATGKRIIDDADPLACRDLIRMHDTKDYRPFVHRMLEVYKQYKATVPSATLDELVNTSVALLFTGEERKTIEQQLAKARLQGRKEWVSVPRLNLGNIKLPEKGQKDVNLDEFVLNAAPLLIEQLAAAQIMSPQEAEQLITRKLGNYFVHQTGFQLSTEKARALLMQLKEPNYQRREGVL